MSEYNVKVVWNKGADEQYTDGKYSRGHQWHFDGGISVAASSSPQVVPLPYSVEANVDPEEAFVASLSSCHMLFFLQVAAKKRYVIEQYVDNAVGLMQADSSGNISITKVTLKVAVTFSAARQPSLLQLQKMHHLSHQQCFIANSVKTVVVTEIIEVL
ncbi:MAG: OsmC family protein [Pseudomonadales bacterium]|nr:OsmC family protein [Pseudomonadales bacterium]NRA17907.1 OsmC family protein [Oceanospirillaceae bacterium]